MNTNGAPPQLQMLVLGLIFVVVALVSDSAWGWRLEQSAKGSLVHRPASAGSAPPAEPQ